MDYPIIGSQIAKFRKALAMTQEELGKAVGVSTQAVSRWECGGTPDVTLLPALADRLGVTVDALFGREGGEAVDAFRVVRNWALQLPRDQAVAQLNRLVWAGITQMPFATHAIEELPYLKSCQEPISGTQENIVCSNLETDHGIYFGVSAEDLAFSMLCPKPETGYDSYFPDQKTLTGLCGLLMQDGCLDLLKHIMSRDNRFYTVDVLAKAIDHTPEQITPLLEALCQTGMIYYTEIGTLDGMTRGYAAGHVSALVPLFYLIRILTQEELYHYYNFVNRQKPLL